MTAPSPTSLAPTRARLAPEARSHVTYLTVGAVVERYGGAYSAWTLREKARRGEVPHVKHPGSRAVLFREDWLDAWDEGAELERRVVRHRGLSAGRIVKPKVPARVPAGRAAERNRSSQAAQALAVVR